MSMHMKVSTCTHTSKAMPQISVFFPVQCFCECATKKSEIQSTIIILLLLTRIMLVNMALIFIVVIKIVLSVDIFFIPSTVIVLAIIHHLPTSTIILYCITVWVYVYLLGLGPATMAYFPS